MNNIEKVENIEKQSEKISGGNNGYVWCDGCNKKIPIGSATIVGNRIYCQKCKP